KDNFCSNCGQVNDLKPLSIKQYLREFLSGFFAFDTRTFHTIFPLLFKPGKVTNDYIKGKRMHYVNPFQLYLHTSIIFFLVIGLMLSMDEYDSLIHKKNKDIHNSKPDFEASGNSFQINFGKTKKDSLKLKSKPLLTADTLQFLISKQVDTIINDAKFKQYINEKINKQTDSKIINLYYKQINNFVTTVNNKYRVQKDSIITLNALKKNFIAVTEHKLKEQNIDYKFSDYVKLDVKDQILSSLVGKNIAKKISVFNKCKTKDVIKALDSLKLPRTKTNIFLFVKTKEFEQLFTKNSKKKRGEFSSKLLSKISIVLFFVLPIFTLILSLLYIRRKFNYTEHLIFTFNMQTVFFILLLISMLLYHIFNTKIFFRLLLIYYPIYLFLAMKRFYKQKTLKTLIKFVIIVLVYFFSVTIGSFTLSAFLAFIS
ncbi:MAG TPA: DUF3667 domain-containing protein, partial [Flavobacteriia bacterium]|nr:DUF3667 domain-containing protein [Flavobacteriia bacterium]